MLDTTNHDAPRVDLLSARALLAAAPISWQRVDYDDAPDALIVEVSVRYLRTDRTSYLMTSTVEIDPETFTIVRTVGPQVDPTTAVMLCADVQRACESGRGVRYRDVFACAEAA